MEAIKQGPRSPQQILADGLKRRARGEISTIPEAIEMANLVKDTFNRVLGGYDRGDWVEIVYATNKTRLALILDRSDRSVGNYRGTVIAGSRACAERTILASEIIRLAPAGRRLCDARVVAGVRCPVTCTRCHKETK
jgi:hypothetical protein